LNDLKLVLGEKKKILGCLRRISSSKRPRMESTEISTAGTSQESNESVNVHAYVCCGTEFISLSSAREHHRITHGWNKHGIDFACGMCHKRYTRRAFEKHIANQLKTGRCGVKVRNNDGNGREPIPEVEEYSEPENGMDNCDDLEHEIFNDGDVQNADTCPLEAASAEFLCALLYTGKIPWSTIASIVGAANKFMDKVCDNFMMLVTSNFDIERIAEQLSDIRKIFDKFKSQYRILKYLQKTSHFIEPKPVCIDTDLVCQMTNGKIIQVYKPITVQYVSLADTLRQYLAIPGVMNLVKKYQEESGPTLEHFRNGEFFTKGKFEDDVIFINIFYDDAETANPLGSKAHKHSLALWYTSLIDMPPWFRSSQENVFLLASCKVQDLDENINLVMAYIVQELQYLWEYGIQIPGHDRRVRIALANVIGDNLGVQKLLGFTSGFQANYFCRFCKMHREETLFSCTEDVTKLRTEQNYDLDILKNDLSDTGLKFYSVLNELPYHHVTTLHTVDIMHDFLEGVAQKVIHLTLSYYVNAKVLSVERINSRIQAFNYGYGYMSSKPSPFNHSYFKCETQTLSSQHASQMRVLLLFLPLILGDTIPDEDKDHWNIFLKARDIFLRLMAPAFTEIEVKKVEKCIEKFLKDYLRVSGLLLTPKFHFLTHYAGVIRRLGPVKALWCMTFESVHKFFKIAAKCAGNYKNVAKTTAVRYQCRKALQIMGTNCVRLNTCEHGTPTFQKLSNLGVYFEMVQRKLNALPTDFGLLVNKVVCNGAEFRVGWYVVYLQQQRQMIGIIDNILITSDGVLFLVTACITEYCTRFEAISVLRHESHEEVVMLSELLVKNGLEQMQSADENDTNVYVVLPHYVFSAWASSWQ